MHITRIPQKDEDKAQYQNLKNTQDDYNSTLKEINNFNLKPRFVDHLPRSILTLNTNLTTLFGGIV